MTFSEEQMENAAIAWSDRIIRVTETEDTICITYRVPTPEGTPTVRVTGGNAGNPSPNVTISTPVPGLDINIGGTLQNIGQSIWEPKAGLMPTVSVDFDPIGGTIQNEIEDRFANGEMTVCHRRRRRNPGLPVDPNRPLPPVHDHNFPPQETRIAVNLPGWIPAQWVQQYCFDYYNYYKQYVFDGSGTDGEDGLGSFRVVKVREENGCYSSATYELEFLNPIAVLNRREPAKYSNGQTYGWVERVDILCYGYRTVTGGNETTFPAPIRYNIVGRGGDFNIVWNGSGSGSLRYFNTATGTKLTNLFFKLPEDNSGNPPSTTPRGNEEMNCCDRINKRLDEIERKLDRLLKFTGAASGGFMVPDSLMDLSPGNNWITNIWDAITPDKQRHIKSLPEFWQWQMEKFKEWFGSWPTLQEDEKQNQFGFPNLAEAVKGIVSKELILQREIAAAQVAIVDCLLETAQDRAQLIYTNSLIEVLIDFFELNIQEVTKPVQFQISTFDEPDTGFEDIDIPKQIGKLCSGSIQNIKVAEIDFKTAKDKNGKPQETFGNHALRLTKLWDTYRALNSVPIDPDNPEVSIKKFLRETKNFADAKRGNGQPISGTDDINDFSIFNEKVEQQFGAEDNPPEGSTTKPWGNDYEDRPRIIVRGQQPDEANDMDD